VGRRLPGRRRHHVRFDYAGPLTEAVLLGSIAARVPETRLLWDSARLKITGSAAAAALLRKGWEPTWVE
jgi:hypothetical protein